MAEHAHTPNHPRPATLEDFDDALSQARLIAVVITQLAEDVIGGTAQPCPSLFVWLGDKLDTKLDRIEVARNTLRGA